MIKQIIPRFIPSMTSELCTNRVTPRMTMLLPFSISNITTQVLYFNQEIKTQKTKQWKKKTIVKECKPFSFLFPFPFIIGRKGRWFWFQRGPDRVSPSSRSLFLFLPLSFPIFFSTVVDSSVSYLRTSILFQPDPTLWLFPSLLTFLSFFFIALSSLYP